MSRNICKFIEAALPHTFEVRCFVLESDPQILRTEWSLTDNRAMLVVDGEGDILLGGERISVGAGWLVFGFVGERLRLEYEGELSYIYISFGGSRAEELFRRFDVRAGHRAFDGFDGMLPLWRDSLARAAAETVDLAAESALLYAFSRIKREVTEHGDVIGEVIRLTEEGFTDPEMSLSYVARVTSYNPKYLSRLFKQRMQVSYSEYLRTLRIKYAVSLFDHGIESVKNVALLSGFSDPLYFSTVFKQIVGTSPIEYKKETEKTPTV